MIGPPILLASGRVARQVAINRSDQPVFIDNQQKLTCHHGERTATIAAWICSERNNTGFVRPSTCDCGNIDGLLTKYDVPSVPTDQAPKDEMTLFRLLVEMGACRLSNYKLKTTT